jgi:hypothetical protein
VEVVSGLFEFSKSKACEGEDTICWIPSKSKSFLAKSYYQVLSNPARSTIPWKSIWKVIAPSRMAFFVWTAALGKILTLDNL